MHVNMTSSYDLWSKSKFKHKFRLFFAVITTLVSNFYRSVALLVGYIFCTLPNSNNLPKKIYKTNSHYAIFVSTFHKLTTINQLQLFVYTDFFSTHNSVRVWKGILFIECTSYLLIFFYSLLPSHYHKSLRFHKTMIKQWENCVYGNKQKNHRRGK